VAKWPVGGGGVEFSLRGWRNLAITRGKSGRPI